MTVLDVRQQIKDNNLQSYYVFTGEEIEVQRIYINKIAEVKCCQVIRADKLSDVWQDIINPSLFDGNAVYVIRDDKDILNNDIDFSLLGDNIIIHLLTNVDKRTKWYKNNSDKIVDFERLSDEILSQYIRQRVKLNSTNCERLIAMCENDYSRILLEIDKIQRYKDWLVNEGYEQETDNSLPACYDDSVFEYLVKEGAIYQPPQDAIFDLVDAILKRQIKRTYDLLHQCYAIGEASLVILNVLYSNTKQVLQVQACESDDICSSTGLTKWQVKCAKDKCGHYSIGELVDILHLIFKLQKGIVSGQIDEKMSVEYLLVNIL